MLPNAISVGPPQIALAGSKKNPKEKNDSGDLFSQRLEKTLDQRDKFSAKPKEDLKKDLKPDKEARNESRDAKEKEPTEDKVSLKDKKLSQSEKQGTTKKKRSDQDQQAISTFMASLESELEIPPQKIEEALAKIDNPSNIQTVDQLVEKLSDQLDLNSAQKTELGELAQKNLAEMSDKDLSVSSLIADMKLMADPKLAKTDAMFTKAKVETDAAGNPLNLQTEAAMQKAISAMNDRFWMKKPLEAVSVNPATGGMSDVGLLADIDAGADVSMMSNQSLPVIMNAGADQSPMSSFMGAGGGGSEFGASSDDSSEKGEVKSLEGLALTGAQPAAVKELSLNDLIKLAPLQMPPMTAAQKAENLENVMSQASMLVKNGGGEMKVMLHPEGLGQVELKVLLQDGKVNLEMVTDSKEAKKLIESQLSDLKMGLAAQKLSIENVKVDVVTPTNTENSNSRLQSDMNSQQNNQTRQFWNQFNENFGSQARRSSYFEMNAPKEIRSERDPLTPVSATSQARATRYDGKGSEINLVG